MKKILVTGASGFIGRRMMAYFKKKGYETVGISHNEQNTEYAIQKMNLLDRDEIRDYFNYVKPSIIMHCAGSADVTKSFLDPEADFQNNVTATHNLLYAVQRAKLSGVRIIFLSSAAVYGNPEILPIAEDAPLNPLSPYAVHKLMCEDLLRYFAGNEGMDIRIARVFSAYGIGLRKQIFWDMFCKYKDTGRLQMYGTGNESRDYIYIDDLARALLLMTIADTCEPICNIANGEEVTIREATEQFAESMGISRDCISFNGDEKAGNPINWRADITRLRKLGYERTVDLSTGLRNYADWLHQKTKEQEK